MHIASKIIGLITSFLRMILVAIGGIVSIVILIPIGMMLMGYRVNANSKELALEATKKGNPRLCATIMNYGFLGPSTGESRSHCVYTYAKIMEDPSVCELLMPSSYGISCVGAATEDDPCFIRPDRSVGGNGIKVGLKECAKGSKAIRENACCIVAKVALLKNENDCSSLKGQTIFSDQCYNELAFKNHDASSCEKISSPTIKSGCIISAKALKQDPSICSGCTPAVESIEDL